MHLTTWQQLLIILLAGFAGCAGYFAFRCEAEANALAKNLEREREALRREKQLSAALRHEIDQHVRASKTLAELRRKAQTH